jgi:hypothetical protein
VRLLLFVLNVQCALCKKELSCGRILSLLQKLLLTIHEDGAINKGEGTPSKFM